MPAADETVGRRVDHPPMENVPRAHPRSGYAGLVPATSAAAVVAELRRRMPELPAVKVQKLLYYCQGHHLQTFDEPLFGDVMKAYEMGPVVPQIWKAEQLGHEVRDDAAVLDEAVLGTINYVVEKYGHMTGIALADRTHTERPWIAAWESKLAGGSDVIERDVIADFFREQVQGISASVRHWLDESVSAAAGEPQLDDLDRLHALRRGVG